MKILFSIYFWQGVAVGLLILFGAWFGLRLTLEHLIMNNYTLRVAGLLPDKMYWADYFYLRFYGINTGFYERANIKLGIMNHEDWKPVVRIGQIKY